MPVFIRNFRFLFIFCLSGFLGLFGRLRLSSSFLGITMDRYRGIRMDRWVVDASDLRIIFMLGIKFLPVSNALQSISNQRVEQ